MPVYKVEPYLEKSIESIINQTYQNVEIILVDDGSPDRCPEICEKYAAMDERIKVIHKKNGGQAEARNFGLDIANGDYIYFIDSDDYAEANAVEVLLCIAEKEKADLVIADIKTVDESGVESHYGKRQYPFPNMTSFTASELAIALAELDWGPWNKLYARKVHENIRFPVGKIHEDEAIMFQLFNNVTRCVYTNQQLYYYVKRFGSTTAGTYSLRKLDWFAVWLSNYHYVVDAFPAAKDRVMKKLLVTAIYNLDNLLAIDQVKYKTKIHEIICFFETYKNEIVYNKDLSWNYKIRCFLANRHMKVYIKLYING